MQVDWDFPTDQVGRTKRSPNSKAPVRKAGSGVKCLELIVFINNPTP